MVNILVGCTGSVATIKLPILVSKLLEIEGASVRIVVTEHAKHFYSEQDIVEGKTTIFSDSDEWNVWQRRGDPVLHIELAKWADYFLIAPLDANTLAKIANVCICAMDWCFTKY